MHDDSLQRVRAFLFRHKDQIKDWTGIANEVAKITTFSALAVGLLILITYLQSVRAPLLISDFSAFQVLLVIAAVYIFVVGFLVLALYVPVFTCRVSRKSRIHIHLRKLDYSVHAKNWIDRLGDQPILFHGSALLTIPTYSILWISRASEISSFLWLVFTLFLGAVVSVLIFFIKAIVPRRIHQFKNRLAFQIFSGSIGRGCWCTGWLYVTAHFNLAFPVVRDNQGSSLGRISTWLIFLLITLSGYLALTSIKARPERLPAAIIIFLVGSLAYKPTFFGQRTLHLLGIGGGIPVELLVKTMEPQGTVTVAHSVRGCLVLNTGSRVTLQLMDVPTSDACGQASSQNDRRYETMYKGITTFSGVDVLKVSGFPIVNQ